MLLSNLSRDSIERGVGYWLGKDIRLLIPLRCNILLEVASEHPAYYVMKSEKTYLIPRPRGREVIRGASTNLLTTREVWGREVFVLIHKWKSRRAAGWEVSPTLDGKVLISECAAAGTWASSFRRGARR